MRVLFCLPTRHSMRFMRYGDVMRGYTDLLQRINEDEELAALLTDAFEFDVQRKAVEESARLACGLPIEAIAGDFTEGRFYLCGTGRSARPVLYASPEGDAGIIATSLSEALTLLVGFPYWRDCLKYSADGDLATMESATSLLCRDLLANRPAIGAEQSRVAEALCLTLESPLVLTARLHAAVRSAGPDFTFSDYTGEYGSLFGPFPPSRNQSWR